MFICSLTLTTNSFSRPLPLGTCGGPEKDQKFVVLGEADYMVDSVSVLVVEVIELVPVDSVVDSDVPSTSGGCSFLGGPVSGPLAFSEYRYFMLW